MEKNWLIRTTSNKILGPISKEKLLEFIDKGALLQSDEVCSGNGYWFYLKEEDLMDQFLYGDMEQTFNPISECPTVLCAKNQDLPEDDDLELEDDHTVILNSDVLKNVKESGSESAQDSSAPIQVKGDVCLPSNDDLEFPDIGGTSDDSNILSPGDAVERKLDIPDEVIIDDTVPFEGKLPCDDDLEFPDFGTSSPPTLPDGNEASTEMPSLPLDKLEEVPAELRPPEHKGPILKKKKSVKIENTKQDTRSDRYLFVIFFAMLGLVFYAVYYYYSKISTVDPTKRIEGFGAIIIPQAHASESIVKKKVYFQK